MELDGASQANVVVSSHGSTVFQGEVIGSKTLSALPRGTYTVTAANVVGFVSPAPQTVELNSDQRVTLTYTRSAVPTQFTAHLEASSVALGPGDHVDVPVQVTALNGFKGKVRLSVTGLPKQMTAESVTVDFTGESTATGHLTLTGDRFAQGGLYDVRVVVMDASELVSVPVEQVALPLAVMVLPPVVTVQIPSTRVYIAEPTDIPLSLAGSDYAGPATLTLEGLPDGITADLPSTVTLGATPSTFQLHLTAGPQAPAGVMFPTLIVTAKGQRLYVPFSVNVQPQRFAASEVAGESVFSIAADAAGNAWYSTWDRMQRVSADRPRAAYALNPPMQNLQVTADGQVVGVTGMELVRLNPTTSQVQRWPLVQYDRSPSTDLDPRGQFVVLDASHVLYPDSAALDSYGFSTLDLTTGQATYVGIPGLTSWPRSATRAGNGIDFLGGNVFGRRLYRFDLDTRTATSFADLHTTGVVSMDARPDGQVWLVTSRLDTTSGLTLRELSLFDPGSGQASVLPGVTVQDTTRVLASPDGSAWLTDFTDPMVRHVDPSGATIHAFSPVALPSRIAVSGGGAFWYSYRDGERYYLSSLR
ncbi:hypothetical protein [Deinococcus sonorensis]